MRLYDFLQRTAISFTTADVLVHTGPGSDLTSVAMSGPGRLELIPLTRTAGITLPAMTV